MSGKSPLHVPIGAAVRTAMYAHAVAAFPNECCGWLTATAARPCVNAQATSAHASTAERTAETAYVIAGDDLLAFARAFDAAEPPLAIYHSHPNGRAYFSATDKAVATSPWGDGPAYPVAQVVIGVDADGVVEVAVFAWSDPAEDFVEIDRWHARQT